MARAARQTDAKPDDLDDLDALDALRAALAPFVAHGRHLRRMAPRAHGGMEMYDQGAHVLVLEHFDRAVAVLDDMEGGR